MKCLAVNTANSLLSLALQDDSENVYLYETAETRDQGNLLIGHAQKALAAAGWSFSDLDILAVATGPGSFTGIRIGIAAMRGIALAADKPLFGISSFDLFAVPADNNIIALESFRDELYFRAGNNAPVNLTPEDFVATLDTSAAYILSGDAAERLQPMLPKSRPHPVAINAQRLAEIAIAQMKESGAPADSPVPFYLREADVTISTKYRKTETNG